VLRREPTLEHYGTSNTVIRDSASTFPLKENAMKKLINAAIFIMFTAVSIAALAESKTVTLSVSGMT